METREPAHIGGAMQSEIAPITAEHLVLSMEQLEAMNITGLRSRAATLKTFLDTALESLSDVDKKRLPELEANARDAELAHKRTSQSALTDEEKRYRDKKANKASDSLHELGEFIRGDQGRMAAYQARLPLRLQLEATKNRIEYLESRVKGRRN